MWCVQIFVLIALVQLGYAQHDYAEVLRKSILFFEAQRSGVLPPSNRVPWRGDSAVDDGSDVGLDLEGGWYDAGDHVKFNFPMAGSTTLLAWSIVDFRDAYSSVGELDNALDSIRWATDYFLKCHIGANEIYGQVADGHADHAFWGRPEDMTMDRPAWSLDPSRPGSDLAAEVAAALSAASMAFRATDAAYADELLRVARESYDFAYDNRGIYSDSIDNAREFYGSSGFDDELCFGAAWLFRATGEQLYRDRVDEFYNPGPQWSLSWDAKMAGAQMLMAIVEGGSYENDVRGFLDSWGPTGGITYTPGGLAWRDMWGPNRYAANTAFIQVLAKKQGIVSDDWGKGQIDYMLGDNPRSSSYVCGYGNNPPQRPHHRAASCNPDHSFPCSWDDYNSPDPNPSVLDGALVGGPDQNDEYVDDRGDYIANEVACDYNAGFQGALAGIVELY